MANICVICDREFFNPFDQRVYKEVKSIAKNGHNIEIITPHNVTDKKKIDDIVVHCISKKGPFGFTALKILKKALQKKYDLFYCHELDPLVYSWILKKITKTPIVWDCHEYLVPMKRELQGDFSALLTKIAISFAAPATDHIITVDNKLGKQLQRFGPVTVIPNYPTILDFPLSKTKKESVKPNILYVGSLTKERGVEKMIKAYKIVKKNVKADLTIVGGFYDKKLEQWAKTYDSKNNLNIKWKGWINYTELAPHFSEADIGLCILQDSERYMKAIATKIFEYLIMGLPVVTSKGHMSDKLIKKEKCGIAVDSTNTAEIAQGIVTLLSQLSNKEISKNTIKFARDKYIWERREEKIINVIDNLI
ncbi:MAG: hypothetical protein CMB62_00955 [Euryarchaeota archaeon]|nr:hypothetical protein [Euryarchaeota archaeon]